MGGRWLAAAAVACAAAGAGCGPGTIGGNPFLTAGIGDAASSGGDGGVPDGGAIGQGSTSDPNASSSAGDAGAAPGRDARGDLAPSSGFSDLYDAVLPPGCSGGACHNPGSQGGVTVFTERTAYSERVLFVVPGNAPASRRPERLARHLLRKNDRRRAQYGWVLMEFP